MPQATREYQQRFYDRHFAARAAAAADQYTHPLFCSFYDRLARRAYDLGPGPRATSARVLEVGCGEGLLGAAFARVAAERELALDYTGVDLSAAGLEQARGRIDGQFLCGDAIDVVRRLPKGSYDLVVIKNLLHHIDEPASLLRAASNATATDGRVVIVEASLASPQFLVTALLAFRRERYLFLGIGRTRRAVASAGLEITHAERFSWLWFDLTFGIRFAWFRKLFGTSDPRTIARVARVDDWLAKRWPSLAAYHIWVARPSHGF